MNPLIEHIRDHYWKNFCEAIGADKENSLDTFRKLDEHYSDPSRHYHTWGHISDCLNRLDEIRPYTIFPVLTEGAIFFHDVIYDSKRKDCEIASGEFAGACLTNMGVESSYLLKSIPLFIEASTHRYKAKPLTEMNLFLDIDLASLGYSLKTFQHNTQQIRKEYSWVPTDRFTYERKIVLDSFLNRPSIYYTDFFRNKYESQARSNLSQPILL